MHALLQSGRHEIFTAEVSDRFGDYGLTGLLIIEKFDDEYRADTFLLSCRVLGRGVEHRLLAFLGEHAEENGIHQVTVPFTQSRKNRPAHDFLESIPDGVRTMTARELRIRLRSEGDPGHALEAGAEERGRRAEAGTGRTGATRFPRIRPHRARTADSRGGPGSDAARSARGLADRNGRRRAVNPMSSGG